MSNVHPRPAILGIVEKVAETPSNTSWMEGLRVRPASPNLMIRRSRITEIGLWPIEWLGEERVRPGRTFSERDALDSAEAPDPLGSGQIDPAGTSVARNSTRFGRLPSIRLTVARQQPMPTVTGARIRYFDSDFNEPVLSSQSLRHRLLFIVTARTSEKWKRSSSRRAGMR